MEWKPAGAEFWFIASAVVYSHSIIYSLFPGGASHSEFPDRIPSAVSLNKEFHAFLDHFQDYIQISVSQTFPRDAALKCSSVSNGTHRTFCLFSIIAGFQVFWCLISEFLRLSAVIYVVPCKSPLRPTSNFSASCVIVVDLNLPQPWY